MTIEDVYIAPHFKEYLLDIKLPKHPMYIRAKHEAI